MWDISNLYARDKDNLSVEQDVDSRDPKNNVEGPENNVEGPENNVDDPKNNVEGTKNNVEDPHDSTQSIHHRNQDSVGQCANNVCIPVDDHDSNMIILIHPSHHPPDQCHTIQEASSTENMNPLG